MGRKRLGVVARSFTIETRQSDLIDNLKFEKCWNCDADKNTQGKM
jgi:hypothetical protein